MRICFMKNFNFDAINNNTKSLHAVEFFSCDIFEIFC